LSRGDSKKWKKWSLAVLVASTATGGTYAQPHIFAAEKDGQTSQSVRQVSASAASVQAEVVAPVIAVDPKKDSISASRKALIKLGMMNLSTAAASDLYSSESLLRQLKQARHRANKVAFDPKASADQIYYASRRLEESIDRYNKGTVSSAEVLGKILKYEKAFVLNGENEHALNEIERFALKGIKEAQAKLAADSTEAGVQAAYKHFLSVDADANDREPIELQKSIDFLQRYQENYAAKIADAGSSAKEVMLQRENYEQAAKAMQSAIGAKVRKNEMTVASANVINAYWAFLEGMRLSDDLKQARPLLDSPIGKEEGQYTASSLRTLEYGINKAESSLKQSEIGEELEQAREKLAVAVRTFKASRN